MWIFHPSRYQQNVWNFISHNKTRFHPGSSEILITCGNGFCSDGCSWKSWWSMCFVVAFSKIKLCGMAATSGWGAAIFVSSISIWPPSATESSPAPHFPPTRKTGCPNESFWEISRLSPSSWERHHSRAPWKELPSFSRCAAVAGYCSKRYRSQPLFTSLGMRDEIQPSIPCSSQPIDRMPNLNGAGKLPDLIAP